MRLDAGKPCDHRRASREVRRASWSPIDMAIVAPYNESSAAKLGKYLSPRGRRNGQRLMSSERMVMVRGGWLPDD
jgi:hypothetical protein